MKHKRLESIFQKKHTRICMHTHHGIHMLLMFTHMTPCMLVCTLVHIVDVWVTLQNFVMIEYIIQILQINLFRLGKVVTPMDPKKVWVPKFTPIVFDVGVSSHKA